MLRLTGENEQFKNKELKAEVSLLSGPGVVSAKPCEGEGSAALAWLGIISDD